MIAGFELRLARDNRLTHTLDETISLLHFVNEYERAKLDVERLGIDATVRQCPYGTRVMFQSEEDLNWFKLNVNLVMEGFAYRYSHA